MKREEIELIVTAIAGFLEERQEERIKKEARSVWECDQHLAATVSIASSLLALASCVDKGVFRMKDFDKTRRQCENVAKRMKKRAK